jgi:hypothetical protein
MKFFKAVVGNAVTHLAPKRLRCWTVAYSRKGTGGEYEEHGYCILWAGTARAALRRAKREFLNHEPGDIFRVVEG